MWHVSQGNKQRALCARKVRESMAKGFTFVITSDDVRTKTDKEIADELAAAMNATDDEKEGE